MLRTLGIALLCLAALAPSRVEAEAPVVIVKQGDALSLIAERAGVSVAQIKEWNRLDGDLIRIGQKLVVAGPKTAGRPPLAKTRTASHEPIDEASIGRRRSTTVRQRRTPTTEPLRDRGARSLQRGRDAFVRRTGQEEEARQNLSRAEGRHAHRNRAQARNDRRRASRIQPRAQADRIYPGQTIDVGEPRPEVVFKLERGDTMLAVADRYGVSPRDLSRWNARLGHRTLARERDIRIYTRVPVSPSEAVGPTNRGRLENGVRLPRTAAT